MRRSARKPNELHIALFALLLSLVVNFGGVAYYVNQDRRTAQTIHDLTLQVENFKKHPAPPVKAAGDELKYAIASFRALERIEKEFTDFKAAHEAFRKFVEPKLEKLEQRRR